MRGESSSEQTCELAPCLCSSGAWCLVSGTRWKKVCASNVIVRSFTKSHRLLFTLTFRSRRQNLDLLSAITCGLRSPPALQAGYSRLGRPSYSTVWHYGVVVISLFIGYDAWNAKVGRTGGTPSGGAPLSSRVQTASQSACKLQGDVARPDLLARPGSCSRCQQRDAMSR